MYTPMVWGSRKDGVWGNGGRGGSERQNLLRTGNSGYLLRPPNQKGYRSARKRKDRAGWKALKLRKLLPKRVKPIEADETLGRAYKRGTMIRVASVVMRNQVNHYRRIAIRWRARSERHGRRGGRVNAKEVLKMEREKDTRGAYTKQWLKEVASSPTQREDKNRVRREGESVGLRSEGSEPQYSGRVEQDEKHKEGNCKKKGPRKKSIRDGRSLKKRSSTST